MVQGDVHRKTDYRAPETSTCAQQEQQEQQKQQDTAPQHEAQHATQHGVQHGTHLLDGGHCRALQRLLPLVQRQLGGASRGGHGAAAASAAAAAIALQQYRQAGAYGSMVVAGETKQGLCRPLVPPTRRPPPAGTRHRPTCSLATAASKPGGPATRVRSKALLLSCCTVHLRKSAILPWRSTLLMRSAPADETSD
jgi:hypothetical protein